MVASLSDPDPPLLYLHAPSQSRRFVEFTKPKTYVLKPPTNNSSPPPSPKQQPQAPTVDATPTVLDAASRCAQATAVAYPAVTFSESREVLDRLSAALWPGPAIIFAPVKTLGGGGRRGSAASTTSTASTSMSRCPSASSGSDDALSEGSGLSRRSRTMKVPNFGAADEMSTVAILPLAALVTRHFSTSADGRGPESPPSLSDRNSYYVGMRCPSHPLARRVLSEVYGATSSSSSRMRRVAVVGHSAHVPSGAGEVQLATAPIKAREVCASLLSLPSFAEDVDRSHPPVVHVLNGEDKREIFAVPTCQFGDVNKFSILMDDSSRTVFLMKRRDENTACSTPVEVDVKGESPGCGHNITCKDITRALLKPLSSMTEVKISSVSSVTRAKGKGVLEPVSLRVVNAVISRWTVVEEFIWSCPFSSLKSHDVIHTYIHIVKMPLLVSISHPPLKFRLVLLF